jgi:serine/threonine-protein kinase
VRQGAVRCCSACSASYRADYDHCPTDGGAIVTAERDPLLDSVVAEHYCIDELIGEGAMGRVYRAHHCRLVNKRYAVKVLLGDLAGSAPMRIRFANEAENVSRLEHPNIVGVLDFGRTPTGLMYLVMELVDGPTLGRVIRDGRLEPQRVIELARQMCDGLGHAHERGVVHRDFKPDNILIVQGSTGEIARITDFGLAISLFGEDARLTQSGTAWCTPAYAAPEQGAGKADQRVDLYALGVTMFEMITGQLPFAGEPYEILGQKLGGDPPLVTSIAPEVSDRLARVIDRLLARDVAKRYAYAQDVLADLDDVAPVVRRSARRSATIVDPPDTEGLASTQLVIRPRWWPRLVIAGAAAVAIAGGVWWVVREPAPSEPVGELAPTPVEKAAIVEPKSQVGAPSSVVESKPVAESTPAIQAKPVAESNKTQIDPVGSQRFEAKPGPLPADKPAGRMVTGRDKARPRVIATRPAPRAHVVEVPSEPPRVVDPPPIAEPRTIANPSDSGHGADSPRVDPAVKPDPKPPDPKPAVAPTRPASAKLVSLDVDGSLSAAVVRRAIDRVLPDVRACATQAGSGSVAVRFTIADTRRAVDVHASGTGSGCVAQAIGGVRTEVAPDVGDVEVRLRFEFGTGS